MHQLWHRIAAWVAFSWAGLFFSPLCAHGQSLIAHWKLNESSGTSAADSSGSGYTGTVSGTATWVSGYINNGFSFNGSTRIQATGLLGTPANITVAAWINCTNADTNGAEVISLGDYFVLRVDAGTNTTLSVYNGSGWTVLNLTSTTLEDTGWHHVAAKFDDANNLMTIYLDGAPAASQSSTVSISYSGLGTNTSLGRHGNGGTTYDFTGIMDDVRVYDYGLSDAEILDLYSRIAYWKLNESSGTTATDSSAYNRNGTVTGTATWTSAIYNNGFSFNGSTRIQATGLLGSPTSLTAAAWANLTTADTNGSEIISLGDRFYLRLDEAGATKVSFYNGSTWVTASVSATYAGSGWHHFAAVFDNPNNALKLYVDGVQAASTTTTSNVSYSGGGANTVIGRHGNSGTSNDFTGLIDDVQVFNYAFSASEVATLYGFRGHWKLSETSGTMAADSSYFAKNGTVSGGASWTTRCNGTPAFDFNGSTQYISITSASNLQPTDAITIAAWVKGDAWGTGTDADVILRKGEAGPNNYQLSISGGEVELLLDATDGGGIQGNTTLATGQWYHVAATWDGANVRIYVNGVLDNTPTARTGSIGTDTRALYIGGRSGGTDCFNGIVYDVRLYSRALLPTEIAQLANFIGHWKLSESSGTTAADSSPFAKSGTVSGGASWSTRCSGTGVFDFNGSTHYISVPNDFHLRPTGAVSIAAWIKGDAWGTGGDVDTIACKGDTSPTYQLGVADGKAAMFLNEADTAGVKGSTTLTAGEWYHVVGTWDGTTAKVYVNGIQDGSAARNGPIPTNTLPLYIGGRSGADLFDGMIYDVRLYDRALCVGEVSELFGSYGFWKLDETSGTTATDSSPAGNNATYVNGVTLGGAGPTTGLVAAQFDGTNDYVGLPTDYRDYSNGLTVAVWAKPTAANSWARFIDIGNGAGNDNIYFSRNGTGTTLEFSIYDGTGVSYAYVRATNAIVLDEWHHYAATVSSAGVAKLYKDAAEISITSGSTGYPTIGLPLAVSRTTNYVGRSNWGADAYYQGQMWDVRVYNRCLCQAELQELYDAGTYVFPGVKIIKWIEVQ
jgi:hypothetical protein